GSARPSGSATGGGAPSAPEEGGGRVRRRRHALCRLAAQRENFLGVADVILLQEALEEFLQAGGGLRGDGRERGVLPGNAHELEHLGVELACELEQREKVLAPY